MTEASRVRRFVRYYAGMLTMSDNLSIFLLIAFDNEDEFSANLLRGKMFDGAGNG